MGENSLQLFFFRMRLSRVWIQVFFYSQKPSRLLHYHHHHHHHHHHHRWQIAQSISRQGEKTNTTGTCNAISAALRRNMSLSVQETTRKRGRYWRRTTAEDSARYISKHNMFGWIQPWYDQRVIPTVQGVSTSPTPVKKKDLRLSSLAFPSNSIYNFLYLKLPFCWVSLIVLEQAIKNALWKMLGAFS